MRSYRCYFLNQAGRIAAVEVWQAETDEEALIQAGQLLKGQPHYRAMEVWDGARRVFPRVHDEIDLEEVKHTLRGVGLTVIDEPGGASE